MKSINEKEGLLELLEQLPLSGHRQQQKKNTCRFNSSKRTRKLVVAALAVAALYYNSADLFLAKSEGPGIVGETYQWQSEGWFPSPRGGTIQNWEESYRKAAELVGKMTLLEK
ncbi:hypothetical protein FN846DRAFT_326248 [Sphaerosporella brunnea]|uniref:Uncharacterized protein n=1 Tax=Sphaerosporella brunnea TaxID=1250544 RepID=A0A5J5EKC1_9PEZI|nr:hypothetical protein FN846DRAFT_326248 [Sphaerosporella brunnea]